MSTNLWEADEDEIGDLWGEDDDQEEIRHEYTPHGGCLRAWNCEKPVTLLHGPAGTGKSILWGNVIYRDALLYPGSRQLILRKTRVSLTESFLVTWEEKVMWADHPVLLGAKRANRQVYRFPNGSVVVVAGMDIPTRIFSAEYDRVYVNEANELTKEEWWSLVRCLRNGVMPYQQLCGDTNPDDSAHQLFANMNNGKIYGIQSYHEDNPVITTEYLSKLRNLDGVLYDRLYLGLWVSAEGLAFPQYNRERHLVDRVVAPEQIGRDRFFRNAEGELEFIDYFGGIDFGWTAPGSLGIFGVDRERRAFLIHEVYAAAMTLDWWAEWICMFSDRYNLRKIVADSAEPRSIEHLNEVLGHRGGREGRGRLIVAAQKDSRAQKDLMRWSLKSDVDGLTRLFICRDTLDDTIGWAGEDDDPGTVQGLAQELPTLRLREPTPANPHPDDYDPRCRDHSTDMTCYALTAHFEKEYAQAKRGVLYAPGTMGHQFDHQAILGLDDRGRPLRRRG